MKYSFVSSCCRVREDILLDVLHRGALRITIYDGVFFCLLSPARSVHRESSRESSSRRGGGVVVVTMHTREKIGKTGSLLASTHEYHFGAATS